MFYATVAEIWTASEESYSNLIVVGSNWICLTAQNGNVWRMPHFSLLLC